MPAFIRTCLLGLLMLAIVCKPVSSLICDTHQLGHLLAASSHVSFHKESAGELQLDAEHASGAHGLMHAGDETGAYVGFAAVIPMPAVRLESVLISLPTELPVPVQHVTKPFRPPIA